MMAAPLKAAPISMPHELILGGQKSGKSRCAEMRAAAWLHGAPQRSAVLLATAMDGDDEMRERISRHKRDRATRVPALQTLEVSQNLAPAVRQHGRAACLVVVDCLTLWLTHCLMPLRGDALAHDALEAAIDDLSDAIAQAGGPVVCVSNEIGLGLVPMSPQARRFVDELGRLHQRLALQCQRVTLMVAGIEMAIKREHESS